MNYWIGVCELAEFAPKVIALLDKFDTKNLTPDKLLREEINKIKPKKIGFDFGFRVVPNKGIAVLIVQLTSFCSTLPHYYIPNVNVNNCRI